jgi:predicted enzyme related to lactoylglutathione lyase
LIFRSARAIQFYSAVLGQPVRKESFPGFSMGLLPQVEKGISGCLAEMEENRPSKTGILIYLNVDGRMEEAVRAVKETGGEVVKEKHAIGPYGFRAIIIDSEGNQLALHSEK